MPRPLANLLMEVDLSADRVKSVQDVHAYIKNLCDKRINKLTGKPFTIISDLKPVDGKKNTFRMTILRKSIHGNYKSDVTRMINKAIAALNQDVNKEVVSIQRRVIGE